MAKLSCVSLVLITGWLVPVMGQSPKPPVTTITTEAIATTTEATSYEPCEDRLSYCEDEARKSGGCGEMDPWIAVNCRKTCGCRCEDRGDYCEARVNLLNQCGNENIKYLCSVSCGVCEAAKGCFDASNACVTQRKLGGCEGRWMAENCQKTCGYCQ